MMSSSGSPQSAGSDKNYYPWSNYATHEEHEEPEAYDYDHFRDHRAASSPTGPSRSGTTSTTSPLLSRGRTVSESSASPAPVAMARNSKATNRPQNKKVNAHSYCGRHSSEYLFGGRGLGDLWRAVHQPKNGKKE